MRARRHPDLITHAVVTNRSARGVRAVKVIVARERRIIPAGIADAVMDGVVPVVIMISILAVPTAVMRLERVMRPANARIRAGYNNVLSGKTQRPYLGRMRVIDARFDCRGPLECRRRPSYAFRLGKTILDVWIAFDSCHVSPRCQCLCNLSGSFHQDCVDDVEGAVLEPAVAQPFQNWSLCGLALVQQCVVNVAAFFSLTLQGSCLTQVSLISEHHEKFCLLAIGSVFHHPRRDLAKWRRVAPARARRDGRLARNSNCRYESDRRGQKEQ